MPSKPRKPVEERLDELEQQAKRQLEVTDSSSEDIRALKSATKSLAKRVDALERRKGSSV